MIINGKALIVDISSMVHCKEGKYKQDKKVFNRVQLNEYIDNLRYEKVDFVPDGDKYILGSLKYLKDFDLNYFG